MKTVDRIFTEASALSPDQKLSLAHRLISSSEPAGLEENLTLWDSEIQERIKRFDLHQTTARPASEVFADLDRRLGK